MDANIDNPIVIYNIVTPNQRLLPAPSSLRTNLVLRKIHLLYQNDFVNKLNGNRT